MCIWQMKQMKKISFQGQIFNQKINFVVKVNFKMHPLALILHFSVSTTIRTKKTNC